MSRTAIFFAALFAVLLAAHLCHVGVMWAEEGLPTAAAAQMAHGKTLYRDIWFDKPPLLPAVYLAWGARTGWPLRLAGALYGLLACAAAWAFARDLWGRREGLWAAALAGFALTFYLSSAVMPLAADLLMVAPHMAAVWLAWKQRPLLSGAAAGLAFLLNPKGLVVLAVCALWSWRALPALAAGFALPNAAALLWLWRADALAAYWQQVWVWGRLYAGGTFVDAPVRNGMVRTLDWAGFHAGLLAAGVAAVWRRKNLDWRWGVWAGLSLAAVAAGWRFFPRYFFQLLPVTVLLAARGMVILGPRRWLALLLLAAPVARFGPRYLLMAQNRPWADTAMDRDSRAASALLRARARPADSLFVWGFRPEMYAYTGMPAATRFLDSQPLTGVPADRHLSGSQTVAPEAARANRAELARQRPAYLIDGLGPYNPRLALTAYPDLAAWLAGYRVVGRTAGSVIYRAGP